MNLMVSLDRELFLAVNHLPHPIFFDSLAKLLSGVGTGGFIWFVVAIFLFIIEERRDHWFFAPLAVAGSLSLLITNSLKFLVARPRPDAQIGAIIAGGVLNDYAFPSAHATAAWALATVLSGLLPHRKKMFILLAVLISFSRVYLGEHYPSDVLAGGILGWLIGQFSFKLTSKFRVHK